MDSFIRNLDTVEYKIDEGSESVLKFSIQKGVFCPTGTSSLLIESCRNYLKTPKKILDLGCGMGLVGIVIAKSGLYLEPLYASDISGEAVRLARSNASDLGVKIIARQGSLFEPWPREKFDLIIDDVSGIADDVANISPWFQDGVNSDAGYDGTRWACQVLESAPAYLKPGGSIMFPVLSLSNESKILNSAKNGFSNIMLLLEKEWFLPKEMQDKIDSIRHLINEKIIDCRNKFGSWTWFTRIYVASNKQEGE